jgi:hypothetical protein
MVIKAGGSVGIGLTNPGATFVVGAQSIGTAGSGVAQDNSIIARFGASNTGARVTGATIANTAAATVGNDATLSFILAENYSATGLISSILQNTTTAGTDMAFSVYNISGNFERMRITAVGNVGIGTTNPFSKLHVNGDIRASLSNVGQANVVAYNSTTGLFTYLATSSISSLPGGSDGQVQYNNGGVFGGASDLFYDDASGNVGIGTAAPVRQLDVYENSTVQVVAQFANSSSVSSRIKFADLNTGAENVNIGAIGTRMAMWTNNTERMSIVSGGNVGIGTNNPIYPVVIWNRGPTGLENRSLAIGNTNTNGTFMFLGTSATTGGYGVIQHISSEGSAYGNLILQPEGAVVGIGTVSPTYALDVYNTGASTARVRIVGTTNFSLLQAQNTSGVLYLGIDDSTGSGFSLGAYSRIIWSSAAYPLIFAVNDAERMRITSTGNVGIGTTNPASLLQVVGASGLNNGVLNISNTYAAGNVYFPAAKFRNTRGDHSFGIISEFSIGNVGSTDRSSILFYSDEAAHSWQVGQVTSPWGTVDSFGIGYRASNTPSSFTNWPTNYFNITPTGNVGIGTGTPSQKLQVAGAIAASLSNVNQSNFVAYNSGTGLFTYAATSSISVGTATNADFVYVSTTTDNSEFSLALAIPNHDEYERIYADSVNASYNPGTGTLTVVQLIETSARKYKENIEPLKGSLENVEQLQGVSFTRIGETDKKLGFIAEEVAEIYPELVEYDSNGEIKGLAYQRLTAVLVEAVKELSDKVKQQEIFIQDLADRLKKLEDKG